LFNTSLTGNNDIANAFDPFGTAGSSAYAGSTGTMSGSSDLAAVLLTDGTATADGSNYLYDILTALGPESGTF
jgi:hypothetical protein